MIRAGLVRRYIRAVERQLLGTITSVETNEKILALTFDDGPHPEFTPKLLNILGRHNVMATFFVVGELAARYPNLIRQMTEAGHEVGNHSWDHKSMPGLPSKRRREQIRKCEKALIGYGQRLFRPPFGHQNFWSRLDPFLMGYRVVTWNVLAEDWRDLPGEAVANYLLERVSPGAIVLLHDGLYHAMEKHYADRSATLEAVDILLNERPEFRYVTVPELLGCGRARKRIWKMPADQPWVKEMKKVT